MTTKTISLAHARSFSWRFCAGLISSLVLSAAPTLTASSTVSLTSYFNITGIYTDGTTFSSTGGLDGVGSAYSGNLLGTSQTWNGVNFTIGSANAADAVTGTGQAISLPAGAYSLLYMLATAENGNQASQTFTVTYTDNSTAVFTQGISNWNTPQNYAGESIAVSMAYRDKYDGTKDNRTFDLFGYTFSLNSTKTVQSITLPNNSHVKVLAMTLATSGKSYASYASDAINSLLTDFFVSSGPNWLDGTDPSTTKSNHDWGADGATYNLYLCWLTNNDKATMATDLTSLTNNWWVIPSPCMDGSCARWSDEFQWDAVAGCREYEATGTAAGLTQAEEAFNYVDQSTGFTTGAFWTNIYWQEAGGGGSGYDLKTLETDSNLVKAAILLYQITGNSTYLTEAENHYSAIRNRYLDATLPVYSVWCYDFGTSAYQQQGRFFASVNGIMIFNGLKLYEITGTTSYLNDANATANAIATNMNDANGIYVNYQSDNDESGPLVEAMYFLWADQGETFAKNWILTNAAAAVSTIKSINGCYGRFYDGPPSAGETTIWQSNGGYALAICAAAIDPTGVPSTTGTWGSAAYHQTSITTSMLPYTLNFTGSGIALIGPLNGVSGHCLLSVDGTPTVNTTGIRQGDSGIGGVQPDTVLFAWRWPSAGSHSITIQPGIPTNKEGPSGVDITSYAVLNETSISGGRYEAENLPETNSSGVTYGVQDDTNGASNGEWGQLLSNATGQSVSYTINIPVSGTFPLVFGYKTNSTRAQVQMSIDGVNVGPVIDEYASTGGYTTANVGNVTIGTSGNHVFKLTVVGKNSSSTNYIISADYFQL